jgi:hypothetical protein
MTAPLLTASSEAIFGSSARGDCDQNSDRDILIVDDNTAVLKNRAFQLSNDGWSVAAYTFDKLAALSRSGALFLQHLKLEANIRFDRGRRLETALDLFSPNKNYTMEINQNSQIAEIAGKIPPSPRGTLLAADILYVTVRNFGILSLAELGVHKYAYSEVVEALEAQGLVSPGGARTLASLRFLKCLYRSGEVPSNDLVLEVVRNAFAILPHANFPEKLQIVAAEDILNADGPPAGAPAYLHLRDLERRLVALQSLGASSAVDEELLELQRWIENPRAYAAISSRIAPFMRETLRQKSAALEQRVSTQKITKFA